MAVAAVSWRLLSKVIWIELWGETKEEKKCPEYYIRGGEETLGEDIKDFAQQ